MEGSLSCRLVALFAQKVAGFVLWPVFKAARSPKYGTLQFFVCERLDDDVVPARFEHGRPKVKVGRVSVDQKCRTRIEQINLIPKRPPVRLWKYGGDKGDME